MPAGRRVLYAVVILALVAAGCNGGTNGGALEVAAVWSGAEQENFQEVLDAFEERTGTSVTFRSTGDDIATFLRTRIEGDDPPDVAILPQPGLMRDLVEQAALQPIEEAVGSAVDENFAPVWRELGTVDGSLYGLFFKGANKSTMWYNVGAFQEAGVQPPATWDELLQAANTLKDAGIRPFSIGGGDAWTLTDWFENIYLRTAGPELYDQLTNHEIPWTHDSVKEALRTFGQVVSDRSLIAGDPLTVEFVDSVDAVFKSPPDAAIVYEGDFVPGVTTVDDAKPKEDFDVFPFPAVGGSSPDVVVGGGDAVVMLVDTPEARELLDFLAGAEAAEIWAALGGFSSPNQNLDPSVYPDEISRTTASALATAEVFRFDMSDLAPSEFGGTAGRGMWQLLQDFVRTPADVDGIAEQLEQAAAAAYRG